MPPILWLLVIGLLSLVTVAFYGLFKQERSILIGILDILFFCLLNFLALYAYFESGLLLWTIGYVMAAFIFLLLAILTFNKPKRIDSQSD